MHFIKEIKVISKGKIIIYVFNSHEIYPIDLSTKNIQLRLSKNWFQINIFFI